MGKEVPVLKFFSRAKTTILPRTPADECHAAALRMIKLHKETYFLHSQYWNERANGITSRTCIDRERNEFRATFLWSEKEIAYKLHANGQQTLRIMRDTSWDINVPESSQLWVRASQALRDLYREALVTAELDRQEEERRSKLELAEEEKAIQEVEALLGLSNG